jgi:lipid A 3-O-deacylase PagL
MRQFAWTIATALLLSLAAAAQEPLLAQPPVTVWVETVGEDLDVAAKNPGLPPMSEYGYRLPWYGEPPNSPFRRGSTVALAYVSGIFPGGLEDSRMFGAHFGGGYFYRDNVSLNLTFSGYWGDHTINSDTGRDLGTFGAGSIEGFMRCHVLNYGSWSLYGEAGLGFWLGSEPVPAGGTKYNFELTVGGGITKQIAEDLHLMCGIRWYHLSNGSFWNSADKNPGLDAYMFYTGLMFQY